MKKLVATLKRCGYAFAALGMTTLLAAMNFSVFAAQSASAAQITSRSLTLSSTAPGSVTTGSAGSYTNGGNATHTFLWTTASSGSAIAGILLQYCTTSIGTCTAPTGMNAASAAKGSIAGTGITNGNWSIDSSTNLSSASSITTLYPGCSGTLGHTNCVALTDSTTDSPSSTVTLAITGMLNPDVTPDFYVHVVTWTTSSYGTERDSGTVASAIVNPIVITAKVKERLGFSTTTSAPSDPSTNCAPLTGGGTLALGDSNGVLDFGTAYFNHSYVRLFTNAPNGVTLQYAGDTLKKGTDDINALTSETVSTTGTEQFGLAFDKNDATSFVTTSTDWGTAAHLALDTGYDEGDTTNNKFNFATGSTTAPVTIASNSAYVTCDTGSIRYVANISPNTPAGTYTTRITYYAVPTF